MFKSKLASERKELIYRLDATMKSGKKNWYYVMIFKHKLSAFKKAIEKGDFNIIEFGEILAFGEGNNPPPETIEALNNKYNIDIIA